MRFFTLFTLGGLAATAIASPVAAPNTGIAKRSNTDALNILDNLFTTIQGYTGTINSTTAGLTSQSTAADNATASHTVNTAVSDITTAINSAIADVKTLSTRKRGVVARQDASPTDIALVIEEILEELSGTLNNVISALGLTSLLGFTTPLTTALSGLVSALEVVVDDLLAVVKELLDGILSGLSDALAGLTL